MKMSISEFRAKCTKVVREVADHPYMVEITNRGKVVAVVSPPPPETEMNPKDFWGSLKGTVADLATDFDEPLGEDEWEAAQ
ncbi:MAG: type II toxin-antitoxin system prevent-host-death family antitoxin [Kiritimatiellia bacterium]|jgi:prevent-host-death family protein|nr:type II toxin-antitoxin system prevent-host-death family antitoxin [Kiritimatiellia bacterium]